MPWAITADLKWASATHLGQAVQVGAGPRGVAFGQVGAGREAGLHGRRRRQRRSRVSWLAPVEQEQAEVGQRLPQGGQLPVQHGLHRRRHLLAQQGVVDPEVPVHDRSPGPPGRFGAQQAAEFVDRRHLAALGPLPLVAPPAHLPLPQARGPAVTGQANRVRVDGVQVGQRVDQDVGDGAPLPGRLRPAGRQGAADDVPVDLLHHVEGHADQVACVLEQDGRHRHGGARQRPLHPGLPAHVVRPRQQRPVRRPAQHRLARVTAQNERQVRLAAGDKGGLQPFPAGVAQRPRERGANQVEPGQVLVHRALPAGALSQTLAV